MKFSWNKLVEFANAATIYLKTHPGETKLSYAINRTLPKLARLNEAVVARLGDIDADYCLTEKTKDGNEVIMREENGDFRFDREGWKKRNAERVKFLNAAEIELDVYFASGVPDTLTETELQAFEGIVVDPIDVTAIRERQEREAGAMPTPHLDKSNGSDALHGSY